MYYNGDLAITPSLTEADAATVQAFVEGQRTEQTEAIFAVIASSPEPDLPWHTGLLKISEDRSLILPEEDESRPGFSMWLRLLLEHFLSARGYILNGQVSWEGEDPGDQGTIYVKANHVETVEDLLFNAGPNWSPNHYASDHLKQAIRDLLDSADNTGCSSDLTVVSALLLEAMRSRLPKY